MKKLVILIIIALSASSLTNAQWQQCGTALNNLEVYAMNGNGGNFFAGAWNSGMFLSTDNGDTWTAINNGLLYNAKCIYDISIKNGTQIYIGTVDGLFLSENAGNSWTQLKDLITGDPLGVQSIWFRGDSILTGVFTGSYTGGVYVSTNNGSNWTYLNNGFTSLGKQVVDVKSMDTNLFAASYGGGLYRSNDDGNSWIAKNNGIAGDALTMNNLTLKDTVVYASTNGGVFLTTNYGNTWTALNNGLTGHKLNVRDLVVNVNDMYIANDSGVYLFRKDSSNWISVSEGLAGIAKYVLSLKINGDYLYAGTRNGVWKRALSEFVGIKKTTNENSVNVFPNPFTKRTWISYLLNKPENVTVILYDTNGKEIWRLEKARQNAGRNNVEFAGDELPAGVYFYKVIIGEKVLSGKLVKN